MGSPKRKTRRLVLHRNPWRRPTRSIISAANRSRPTTSPTEEAPRSGSTTADGSGLSGMATAGDQTGTRRSGGCGSRRLAGDTSRRSGSPIARCGSGRSPRQRMKQLRAGRAAIEGAAQEGVQSERAVEWLRALAETWVAADVLEVKAELLHAIYERIVVAGRTFVGARLTPAAYANGLALALPQQVVMVRPTRFELATFGFGGRRSIR